MRSSGPRRDLLEVLGVLAAVLAVLSALASGTATDDDTEWDAVSEFPGAERQGAILQALSLGLNFTNVSRNDCVWRRPQESHDPCPGEDVTVHLYTSTNESRLVNVSEANSLLQGDWDAQKHTIVLVHGYGGGHDTLPMSILRDAYLLAGGYNVLVVDWSPLARLPCYPAAVHNSAVAARCVGGVARLLRDSGARGDAWTCVGHSLGAHVCGIMADTVMFRVHKIIGLDPARPLIRPQNKHRLDAGDASVVHVMHTNAGHYGELGAMGTADFCVNGGRAQPFCSAAKNPNLCSHLSSICFLADSIDGQAPMAAEPCGRRCPSARRHQSEHKQRLGLPSSLGQHTPDSASGTFCASSDAEPYCQREPGGRGHPRCCPPRHQTAPPPTPTATTVTTAADAAADAAREEAAAAATTALSTAGPSTASTVGSTVGTEAATAAPATTTQSSFKVGAALPALPTTTSTTTSTPAPQPGFSPVTYPMRADKVTLPDEASSPGGDPAAEAGQQSEARTTPLAPLSSLPVTFPTPAAQGPAAPGVDDIPVVMMPPPMPLPDWKPVVFVDDKQGPAESVRPQEPVLVPLLPQPRPTSLPWDIPLPANANAQGGEAPGRWTPPQPQPITPQRWTPPPIRVPSEPPAPAATTPAPAPAAPIRWPTAVTPGVHIVMPSNDTSLYDEPVTEEGPVIAIYSTKSPLGPPPPPSPLVVVTANSEAHHAHQQHQRQQQQQHQQQHQQHKQQLQPQHQHDIRDNLIEPSTAFTEVTLSPAGLSNTISIDQEMMAMMEMSPPPPDPLVVGGFPSPSPPPPEPAVPEEPGMIPAAGSPTGSWLPLVMMPPTPFSVDSWALRYKDRLPRPSAVRRTSYRKRIYD